MLLLLCIVLAHLSDEVRGGGALRAIIYHVVGDLFRGSTKSLAIVGFMRAFESPDNQETVHITSARSIGHTGPN